MHALITGTPGVGKTSVARILARKLKAIHINEKEFAIQHNIGNLNIDTNEWEIPLSKLQKTLNKFLAQNKQKNIIIEGHTLCETKLKVDIVIVLKVNPEILEERLSRKRNYSSEKIMDNVFCEGIDYCLKHVKRRYKQEKLLEVKNEKNINSTIHYILTEINKRSD